MNPRTICLLLGLLCCSSVITAQSAPLLQRLISGDTNLLLYRQPTFNLYNVAAVMDKAMRRLYFVSRYGELADSIQLTNDDYRAVINGAISPFVFGELNYDQLISIGWEATQQLVSHGKIDPRWQYAQFIQKICEGDAGRQQPLEKLRLLDELCGYYQSKKWLLSCADPAWLIRDSAVGFTNEDYSTAGQMHFYRDSIVYYNKNPLLANYKAVLQLHRGALLMFDRNDHILDSLVLQQKLIAGLVKAKTDMFLYYRGWLAMRGQVIRANIHWLQVNNQAHPSALVQASGGKMYQPALIIEHLNRQLEKNRESILQAAYPSRKSMATIMYKHYSQQQADIDLLSFLGIGYQLISTRGQKYYELADHRGNVLVTITDRKIPHSSDGRSIDYYQADVVTATDYYPFGMTSRSSKAKANSSYRYGFNGKENDNEVKGEGNQQDYGMRMYDPRLGRFLSVDPIAKNYPELTPYQFASNTPIQAIDLDGLEAFFVHGTWSDKSTWDPEFVKSMMHVTNWDKVKQTAFYGNWSGANKNAARNQAANVFFDFLVSEKNPYRALNHVTLIGHSHGGNVNKVLANKLTELGWRVDILNIETPQRSYFTKPAGTFGIALNFSSKADLIQFAGAFGSKSATGSRHDWSADKNIELPEIFPTVMPGSSIPVSSVLQWLKDSGGHSLHNNGLAQAAIITETKKAFEAFEKQWPNGQRTKSTEGDNSYDEYRSHPTNTEH